MVELNPEQFKLSYVRRKGSAPDMGERYGQHIEPHGRYLSEANPGSHYDDDLFEKGEVTFKNPLHMPYGDESYAHESNWKNQLSQQHGGATGRKLSNKIVAAGHDAIITHDDHGTREIVDLTGLKKRKR